MMPTEPVPTGQALYRWHHKMSAILFIAICLETGMFLVIFPWTEYWDGNYFAGLLPRLHPFWDNLYLRGAMSGLGIVNVYISLVEVFRLRRFSRG